MKDFGKYLSKILYRYKFKKLSGFTLVEMLVTVLIISVLSGIVLPQYLIAVKKARLAQYMALVKSIEDAEERHRLATGEYTPRLDLLDIGMPVLYKFCSLKKQNSGDYYDCQQKGKLVARYGLFNNVSNAQAGDVDIRYLHVFKDYRDNGVNFKKGDIACFAKTQTSRKACKSAFADGVEYNGTGWNWIYLLNQR